MFDLNAILKDQFIKLVGIIIKHTFLSIHSWLREG